MTMKAVFSGLFEPRALTALFGRELRLAALNRYLQVLSGLALAGGIVATVFSEDANTIGFFHVQAALYFVSLFALLAGVNSAQAEREEWQLLFTQPLPRPVFVVGKFLALSLIFAALLTLLFLPTIFAGAGFATTARLYLETLMLGAVFVAGGLAAGYCARDRAQALIAGVSGWLLLLFGFDLVALFAAQWSGIQKWPDLWVALLMTNPLDSFRIDALFALQQIPSEAANKTALAGWWTAHSALWFTAITLGWSIVLVTVSGLRMTRWEE
jgi:ABC-type transport system involved in multi-copper enzyme maturation permease subunit